MATSKKINNNKIRHSQPQSTVGIDWSNPITRGLVLCTHAGNNFVEMTTNKPSTITSAQYTATPHGKALANAGSTFSIATPINAFSGEAVTWVIGAQINSTGGGGLSKLVYKGNSGQTAGFEQVLTQNGGLSLSRAGSTSTALVDTLVTLPQPYAVYAVSISSFTATDGAWYINGVPKTLAGTSAVGTGVLGTSTASLNYSLGNRTYDNARNLDGKIEFAYRWNRVLSPAEVAAISANPYQIFKAANSAIYLPSGIVTNGLVLHLDAANTSSYPGSGTTWTDVSGNGFTGTLVNGPTYNSENGGSIVFDGVNDYVLANQNASLKSKFSTTSVSHFSWVYPTAAGQLVSELGSTDINGAWHDSNIEISASGAFSFSTWHGGLTDLKVVSSTNAFNAWYYVGFTYDGTTLTAYINGSAIGTTTFTRQAPYLNGNEYYYALFAIDSTNMGTYAYGTGRCATFSVYNRSLSAAEVQQNYDALSSRYTTPQLTPGARLSNTGNYFVNGYLDEVSKSISSLDSNYILYAPLFDEVTFASNFNFARRIANTGNTYITGSFDEVTKVS